VRGPKAAAHGEFPSRVGKVFGCERGEEVRLGWRKHHVLHPPAPLDALDYPPNPLPAQAPGDRGCVSRGVATVCPSAPRGIGDV